MWITMRQLPLRIASHLCCKGWDPPSLPCWRSQIKSVATALLRFIRRFAPYPSLVARNRPSGRSGRLRVVVLFCCGLATTSCSGVRRHMRLTLFGRSPQCCSSLRQAVTDSPAFPRSPTPPRHRCGPPFRAALSRAKGEASNAVSTI
jgi:hypothetical protein